MNINDIPDLCLTFIFKNLSLSDQLRAGQVCKHWRFIQLHLGAELRHLSLLIGEDAVVHIKRSNFRLAFSYAIPGEENVESADDWEEMIVPAREKLEFGWLGKRTAEEMVNSFPNITSLQLCLNDAAPIVRVGEKSWGKTVSLFDHILYLLNHWAQSLTSLKLLLFLRDDSRFYEDELDRRLPQLIAALNTLSQLKHLTMETSNNFYIITKEQPLNLPILSRLNEFYWSWTETNTLIFDELERYAKSNTELKAIGIDRVDFEDMKHEEMFTNKGNSALLSKFVQLPNVELEDASVATQQFCSRFNSLKRIGISVDSVHMLYKLVGCLKPMKQLKFLYIDLRFDEEETDQQQQQPVPTIPTPIESVESLSIDVSLNSHDELAQIAWNQMFPNLRVMKFHNYMENCAACDTANNADADDDGNDNGGEIEENNINNNNERSHHRLECMRQCLKSWRGCHRLEAIYSSIASFASQIKSKWTIDELV